MSLGPERNQTCSLHSDRSRSGLAAFLATRRFRPAWTWGRCPPEQAFRAQVFVDVRPVNSVATTGNAPFLPFGRGSVEQPGIPGERNDNGTSIPKRHANGVPCEFHIDDAFVSRQCQNAHSRPPRTPF